MASAEPKCAVPMVAQLIVSIGMHEHVERSVIQRQPTHDVGKLWWRKRDSVAPTWMRSDLSLVKAAHLNVVARLCSYRFAKFPGGITTGGVEYKYAHASSRYATHRDTPLLPPFVSGLIQAFASRSAPLRSGYLVRRAQKLRTKTDPHPERHARLETAGWSARILREPWRS